MLLRATSESGQDGHVISGLPVRKSASALKPFTGENRHPLVWEDSLALLILSLLFDVINNIGRFDLQGNGFVGKRLDKDPRASTKAGTSCLPSFRVLLPGTSINDKVDALI